MGVIADFLVSADTGAARDDGLGDLPEVDLAEYKRVKALEISMLWAILRDCDWDVEMMDSFTCVLEKDGGQVLIHRMPDDFVAQLASMTEDALSKAAAPWTQTEELCWDPSAAEPVLRDLRHLAQRAQKTARSLYVFNSV